MLLTYAMSMQRRMKVFRNGRNRAVRIPREFDFPGDDIVMRKEGGKLTIEPVKKKQDDLLEWLAKLEPIEDEFPEIDDPPPEPVDL